MKEETISKLIAAGAAAERDVGSAKRAIQNIMLTWDELHEGAGAPWQEQGVVDAMPEFFSGSVAPVVWIMRVLSRRLNFEKFHALLDWVEKHDPRNSWILG
jgi:hypothetical protein